MKKFRIKIPMSYPFDSFFFPLKPPLCLVIHPLAPP